MVNSLALTVLNCEDKGRTEKRIKEISEEVVFDGDDKEFKE